MIPKHRLHVHPGEVLLGEFIIPRKISQVELARKIKIPVSVSTRSSTAKET